MIDPANHTRAPWAASEPFEVTFPLREVVAIAADGGVIAHVNCAFGRGPEDAAFIVKACNAHEELLALARQYASECAECGGSGEEIRHGDDTAYPCTACEDIRAVIAKAVQS